ncbi:hypothetical protein KJ359_001624 [Pestalotiopsis sp. 9143b]|nr:hypothetical protein KJ359_001624 [Pestalotiopsis sp. 9143b]
MADREIPPNARNMIAGAHAGTMGYEVAHGLFAFHTESKVQDIIPESDDTIAFFATSQDCFQ